MFQRVIYDQWADYVPFISFGLTFLVFLAICVRACFLRKEKVRHLENLPLNDEDGRTSENHKV